jgi:hypothetical protein
VRSTRGIVLQCVMKFGGERWQLFGPIIEDSGPAG